VRRQQRHAVRCWHCLTPITSYSSLRASATTGKLSKWSDHAAFPLLKPAACRSKPISAITSEIGTNCTVLVTQVSDFHT
jgi:hypothetical protein